MKVLLEVNWSIYWETLISLTSDTQTSEMEETVASLSEELQKRCICPSCGRENVEALGGILHANQENWSYVSATFEVLRLPCPANKNLLYRVSLVHKVRKNSLTALNKILHILKFQIDCLRLVLLVFEKVPCFNWLGNSLVVGTLDWRDIYIYQRILITFI